MLRKTKQWNEQELAGHISRFDRHSIVGSVDLAALVKSDPIFKVIGVRNLKLIAIYVKQEASQAIPRAQKNQRAYYYRLCEDTLIACIAARALGCNAKVTLLNLEVGKQVSQEIESFRVSKECFLGIAYCQHIGLFWKGGSSMSWEWWRRSFGDQVLSHHCWLQSIVSKGTPP